MQADPGRRIDACLEKYLLGKSFVHCHRASERVRSGVADAEQVKCGLKLSVLTFSAVETEKCNVGKTAEFNDIWSEETIRLVWAGGFDSLEVRLFLADIFGNFKTVSGQCEYIFQILRCILKSQKYIKQKCVVSFVEQCTADSGSGGERNVALPPVR